MFQHPLFAKRLFDQKPNGSTLGLSERILPLATQSAVYHHEWWNGTGYPYRIKYDAIPFVARITSICDAYDAMYKGESISFGQITNYTRYLEREAKKVLDDMKVAVKGKGEYKLFPDNDKENPYFIL